MISARLHGVVDADEAAPRGAPEQLVVDTLEALDLQNPPVDPEELEEVGLEAPR